MMKDNRLYDDKALSELDRWMDGLLAFKTCKTITLKDINDKFLWRNHESSIILLSIQLYILRKKASPEWNVDNHPFPRDVEYMIADTMEVLRPKLRLFTTVDEALNKVKQIQKDHQEQMGKNGGLHQA